MTKILKDYVMFWLYLGLIVFVIWFGASMRGDISEIDTVLAGVSSGGQDPLLGGRTLTNVGSGVRWTTDLIPSDSYTVNLGSAALPVNDSFFVNSSVSGSIESVLASASQYFGTAFTIADCSAAGDTLNWNGTTGAFTCGTDSSGGGGTAIGLSNGGAFTNVTSLSFEANQFDVTFPDEGIIKLDWTNGPASRSANETINGDWTFATGLDYDSFLNTMTLDADTTIASAGFSLDFNTGDGANLYIGDNIGIGTTAPAGALDIAGNLYFTGSRTITTSGAGDSITINPQGALALGTGSTDSVAIGRTAVDIPIYLRGTISNDGTVNSGVLTVGDDFAVTGNASVSNNLEVAGQLILPNGSVGAPALIFDTNPDTGIYYSPVGIRFSVDGVQNFLVAQGWVTFPGGSAGAPGINFGLSGDTDTGLYSTVANTVGITTSGVTGVFISSSSNVGINNTTPTTTLDVTGNASVSGNFEAISGIIIGDGTSANKTIDFDNGTGSIQLTDSGNAIFSANQGATGDTILSTNGGLARFTITGSTGDALFAQNASISNNFEVIGTASVSSFFGAGLGILGGTDGCSAAGDTLNYTASTGLFSCGTDASGGGGGTAIGVANGGAFTNVTSISFDAGMFDITYPDEAFIKLDWTNGPASRSANETITGDWTFTTGLDYDSLLDTMTLDADLTVASSGFSATYNNNAIFENRLSTQLLSLTPHTTQSITANTQTIMASSSFLEISSDADYLMTSTPNIASGSEGTILALHNTGSFTITLQENSTLGGSSIYAGAGSVTIDPNSITTLMYHAGTNPGWYLQSNPNTVAAAGTGTLEVRNVTGVTIPIGSPVYSTGWNNGQGRTTIGLADGDDPTMMPVIGITISAISTGTNSDIVTQGIIENLNTSSFTQNDKLYVGTTAGTLVNTRPSVDDVQVVAIVLRSSAAQGVILVVGAGRANDIQNTVSTDVTFNGGTFSTNASISNDLEVTNNVQIAGTLNLTGLGTFGAITATGVIDFSGATSLAIPAGANPTVNSSGEIAIDDDGAGQLVYYASGSEQVLTGEKKMTLSIASTSFNTFTSRELMYLFRGITITRMTCNVSTATSVVVAFEDGSANATDSLTCGTSRVFDDGSIANATMTKGESLVLTIGAVTGEADFLDITIMWTEARE